MNSVSIQDTIKSLCPDAGWGLIGRDIEWEINEAGNEVAKNIIWNDSTIPFPTREQIETRMSELQAISDSLAYKEQRKKEYPPLGDLADALYWQANGDSTKMTTYLAQIAAVKDKYPKGTL